MKDWNIHTPLGRGSAALVLHSGMADLVRLVMAVLVRDLVTVLHRNVVTLLSGDVVTVGLFVLIVSRADLLVDSLALLLVRRAALLLRHGLDKAPLGLPESTELEINSNGLNTSLANLLGDSVALLGVDGVADDVTDGEALLVLTDLQLGLTDLVWDILAVELRHRDTLLGGDGGAGGGVH